MEVVASWRPVPSIVLLVFVPGKLAAVSVFYIGCDIIMQPKLNLMFSAAMRAACTRKLVGMQTRNSS